MKLVFFTQTERVLISTLAEKEVTRNAENANQFQFQSQFQLSIRLLGYVPLRGGG